MEPNGTDDVPPPVIPVATEGNIESMKQKLKDIGFACTCTIVDPKRLVGVTSRPRVKFLAVHVNRYCDRMGINDDELGKLAHVNEMLDTWRHIIDGFMSCTSHPALNLDQFLFEEGHDQLTKYEELLVAKESDPTPSKRGRPGSGWTAKHRTRYEKDNLVWPNPMDRLGNYADNAFIKSYPAREIDIVLYWDKVRPVEEREEELCLSLCLTIIAHFSLLLISCGRMFSSRFSLVHSFSHCVRRMISWYLWYQWVQFPFGS